MPTMVFVIIVAEMSFSLLVAVMYMFVRRIC